MRDLVILILDIISVILLIIGIGLSIYKSNMLCLVLNLGIGIIVIKNIMYYKK